MKKIILASQSPRRKELMNLADFDFDIIPSNCEEIITEKEPCKVVEQLSKQKALDVYNKIKNTEEYSNNILVIGADTIVSIDGQILGKPKSREESYNMIKKLQGNSHEVYTGVTLIWKDNELKVESFYEKTEVIFYPMTDEEITALVNTGDGDDKAGSYGIQGKCAKYIKGIIGDYNNVVGLPIARIYQEINNFNIM